MSLPALSTHSYPSVLPPITPNISHDFRLEDSTSARKPYLQNIPEVSAQHWTAPFRDGLPTPPNDMNGVACNRIQSTYGGKLDGVSLPPYGKASNYSRTNSQPLAGMVQQVKSQSQPSIQEAPTLEPDNQKKSKSSSTSYLQIPPSINNSKGSLAEFAAQMTCLFWFETTTKLKAIETCLNSAATIAPEAIPTLGFQKWVTNILSTTQVSQNVILLALLFIYRLKKSNPAVRGKKGSEYRLMTIALMLGNKFLDDNTYTNKTWAEVSGISVQEIHIMEVEFLSNVRYNLYASESEWAKWHAKLSLFADFFNNAPLSMENQELAPVLRVSPTLGPSTRTQLSAKLPSPPASEPFRASNWGVPMNAASRTGIPQLSNEVSLVGSRKRTHDESGDEHPSKKIAMPNAISIPASTLPSSSSALASIPALPPMLAHTAPRQQTVPKAISHLPRPNLPPSSHTLAPGIPAVQFPVTTSRSMPPVYNPASWIPQIQTPVAMPPMTNGLFNPGLSLPDPGRPNSSTYGVSSATVSPAVSAYSLNTPQTHLSPSFFLANRNSPYRPVRSVNTLLIPPPSASLQQQRNVPFDHMHYQPLGKSAADRKTGLLPYLHHEAWPQGAFIHPSFHTLPTFPLDT